MFTHISVEKSKEFENGLCYRDSADNRLLNVETKMINKNLYIEKCLNHCRNKNAVYAGLQKGDENGDECWCGLVEQDLSDKIIESENCNNPCKQFGYTCGGELAINIYKLSTIKEKGIITI